jgi:hypothetical protein
MAKRKHHTRSQRRRKRRPTPTRRARQEQAPQLLTAFFGSGGVSARPVAAQSVDALHTYFAAHDLLPRSMSDSGVDEAALIERSLRVLDDSESSAAALLEALVILGHTPTMGAYEALQRHAASKRPHADVAALAAEECLDWIAHFQGMPGVMN